MARGISQHLVEQVGELSDDSTVSVVYADQGAHGRDLRKVVLGAWGWGDIGAPTCRYAQAAAALPILRNVGAGLANVDAGISREAEIVSQLCVKEDFDSHGQFVSQLNQQDSSRLLAALECS